jgi:hypothetical protein
MTMINPNLDGTIGNMGMGYDQLNPVSFIENASNLINPETGVGFRKLSMEPPGATTIRRGKYTFYYVKGKLLGYMANR